MDKHYGQSTIVFGFNNPNAGASPITETNLENNDVVQFLLDELQMNDTCGVYNDFNNLFNAEDLFTSSTEAPTLEDDGGLLSFFEDAWDSAVQTVDNFMDWVENRPRVCHEYDREQFRDVWDDFATCTGYNFQELLESIVNDSTLQSGLQCTGELLQGINGYPHDSFCEDVPTTVQDACVDGILASDLLGDFYRLFMVSPGVVCNCLSVFDRLPDCKVNPFAMSGRQLKKYVCVMNGQTCPFFSDICDGRLFALNECLPSLNELNQDVGSTPFLPTEDVCRDVMCDCEAMNNGKMNYPARLMELPLSDMCVEKASNSGTLSDVPERYELFRNSCMNDNFALPAANDLLVEETTAPTTVSTTVSTTVPTTVPTIVATTVSTTEISADFALTNTSASEMPEVAVDEVTQEPIIAAISNEQTIASTGATFAEIPTNSSAETISREVIEPEGAQVRNGILIGAGLLIGLLAVLCVACCRRRKRRDRFVIIKEPMVSGTSSHRDIVLAKDFSVSSEVTEQEDMEVSTVAKDY